MTLPERSGISLSGLKVTPPRPRKLSNIFDYILELIDRAEESIINFEVGEVDV